MIVPNRKNLIITLICLAGLGLVFFVFHSREILIGGSRASIKSPISGLTCDNAGRRPVAVMMPSDPETIPLSGIGQADLVVEMPVTPNGVTRFMMLFQCQTPKEIGSVRSARDDFVPLAAAFKSIYAHWGGEHSALNRLNRHILDNVDALKYEGTVYYRKQNVPMPHNGFTTLDRVIGKAKDLGYDLNLNFSGYPHLSQTPKKNLGNLVDKVEINYPYPYNILWQYSQTSHTYKRTRGGAPETDKNTGAQAEASVIVKMKTTSRILREYDQYVVVKTTGSGEAEIYQGENMEQGTWEKDPSSLVSKLYFYNSDGKEIAFVPGTIWIEIVTD